MSAASLVASGAALGGSPREAIRIITQQSATTRPGRHTHVLSTVRLSINRPIFSGFCPPLSLSRMACPQAPLANTSRIAYITDSDGVGELGMLQGE